MLASGELREKSRCLSQPSGTGSRGVLVPTASNSKLLATGTRWPGFITFDPSNPGRLLEFTKGKLGDRGRDILAGSTAIFGMACRISHAFLDDLGGFHGAPGRDLDCINGLASNAAVGCVVRWGAAV
jgi:hypothetical protein